MATFSSSLTRYRADRAASRLAADINNAKANANHVSVASGLSFAATNNAYQPIGGWSVFADGSASVDLTASPYNSSLVGNSFPAQVIGFDAYGNALAGGTLTLVNGDQQRVVTLDADTGDVTIEIIASDPASSPAIDQPQGDGFTKPPYGAGSGAQGIANTAGQALLDSGTFALSDISTNSIAQFKVPADEWMTSP
ncbi:MAG: GspH/FimT family protein [Planctomycetota bacterium]